MMKSVALVGGLIGAWNLCSSTAVHAQDLANDVVRCGAIADDAPRLRCFDGLIPEARKSEEQRRAEADENNKRDFGLTATQRSEQISREHPDKEERKRVVQQEHLQVEATITDFSTGQYGTIFALDNGQVWQTTSSSGMTTVPRIGQKVTVRSGPLGGYRLLLEGKTRELGVKRVK
jgi:hypothetical protein